MSTFLHVPARARWAVLCGCALAWGCGLVAPVDDAVPVPKDDARSGAAGAGTPEGAAGGGWGGGSGAGGAGGTAGLGGGGAAGTDASVDVDAAGPDVSADADAGGDGDGPDAHDATEAGEAAGEACVKTTCAAEGKNCGPLPDNCGGTIASCGTCTLPQTCGGGGTPNVCGCKGKTCSELGKECGTTDDGCGFSLNCGTCTAPKTCGGGGTPGKCGEGPCVPKDCGQLGKNCGTVDNGCGTPLSCGTCTAPQTCGGGGTPNVCGCKPTTCVAEGKNCGSISDKCGGTLDCGTCPNGQTCGGGNPGVPNVCGCTKTTCLAQGKDCGTIPDGCGGTLSCGTCAAPTVCGAGNPGAPNVCGCPMCVEAPPAGWTGPVAVWAGAPGSEPSCGASYPTAKYTGNQNLNSPPPAVCTPACGCTGSNPQCNPAVVTVAVGTTQCGTACATHTYSAPPGTCFGHQWYNPPCDWANMGNDVRSITVSGTATCAVTQSPAPTLPGVTWAKTIVSCAPSSTGSCGGQACVPWPPPAPLSQKLCIFKAGDNGCPAGAYTSKTLYYGGVTDTRGCTACSCGAGTADCSGKVTGWYGSLACTGSGGPFDFAAPSTGCAIFGGGVDQWSYKYVVTPKSPTCPASGGQPTGTAVPASPTTVCCMP